MEATGIYYEQLACFLMIRVVLFQLFYPTKQKNIKMLWD
jgi:hypothetical protein